MKGEGEKECFNFRFIILCHQYSSVLNSESNGGELDAVCVSQNHSKLQQSYGSHHGRLAD